MSSRATPRLLSTGYAQRWYKYTKKTTSSRKQEMRCMVGMRMMNAKRSSMKVFTNRKHRNRHGRWETDLRWWLMNNCQGRDRLRDKWP